MKASRYVTKKGDIRINRLNSLASRIVFWLVTALALLVGILSVIWYARGKIDAKRLRADLLMVAAALALFNIPNLLQNVFRIYVPTSLHMFAYLFAFMHCILGEIGGIYQVSAVFDKILHFTSGAVCTFVGLSAFNLADKRPNSHQKMNPLCVALFCFCFSMMIAAVWEIFEFGLDSLIHTNMQRYEPPSGAVKTTPPVQGYGLIDTMDDVIFACFAALSVSILLFVLLRANKRALNFVLMRKLGGYDAAIAEAEESGDTILVARLKKCCERAGQAPAAPALFLEATAEAAATQDEPVQDAFETQEKNERDDA